MEFSLYKIIKYFDGIEVREVLIENIYKWFECFSEVCICYYWNNNEFIFIWVVVEVMFFDIFLKMILLYINIIVVDEFNQLFFLGKNC